MAERALQQEHFARLSADYFRCRQHPNHCLVRDLMWEFFLRDKAALKKPGLSVLEPMCGFGEGKEILEKNLGVPLAYEGFDLCPPLVEAARARFPGAHFYVQDVLAFSPSRPYDLVMVLGGLHHIYRQAGAVVERLTAAARPGGYFLGLEATDHNRLARWIRNRIYRRNPVFQRETERAFSLPALNGIFRDRGWRLVDQIYPGLLSYILYYNPDAFPRLNRGGRRLVRLAFRLDRPFFRSFLGRKLSFATLSLWQKA